MLAYYKYHGIGVIPWSPVAGGRLARALVAEETPRAKAFASRGRGIPSEVDSEIIKRVDEITKKRGWTMAQVCNLHMLYEAMAQMSMKRARLLTVTSMVE